MEDVQNLEKLIAWLERQKRTQTVENRLSEAYDVRLELMKHGPSFSASRFSCPSELIRGLWLGSDSDVKLELVKS